MEKGFYKKLEIKDDTMRLHCFIRVSGKLTVNEIVDKVWWAKTWKMVEMSNEPIIHCRVKPWDWKEFKNAVAEIKAEFLPFSYEKNKEIECFTVRTGKNIYTIYE